VVKSSGSRISSAEATRRLGVSGKALRVYEARGLINPERTPAGWRVYGPDQIARLHQIIALKGFGLSLGRIAELLSGRCADLDGFLALHETVLRGQLADIEKAIGLVRDARARIADGLSLSSDDLMDLTRRSVMTDMHKEDVAAAYEAIAAKHLSPEDKAVLAANGASGMDKDDGWGALNAEAARLMETSTPASPEAMALAQRWMAKVFAATGGDLALNRKVKAMAREVHEQPAFQKHAPQANAIMDFIASAYGAAIAAGLMPDPQ
jgi:DNA-binding transcriptional MerR regulator